MSGRQSGNEDPPYMRLIDETSLDTPNEQQRRFIMREEEDFAILQGPPGTGKSLALAHAILRQTHEWISDGLAIKTLVVAPSHRAVNATLEKVDQFKHKIEDQTDSDVFESLRLLRVLSRDRDHNPDMRTNVEYVNYNTDGELLTQLRNDIEGQQTLADFTGSDSFIFFATPSGGHRIVDKMYEETIEPTFDLFAVDEASMMTVTDFLMAGSSTTEDSRTLVVGDHRQLSPVQKYDWEREDRRTIRELVPYLSVMDLFRLLSEDDDFGDDEQFDEVNIPGTVDYPIDRLEITYRCDEEVAAILRDLVYERDGINYRSFVEDSPSRRSERQSLAVETTGRQAIDTALDPANPIVIIVHHDRESQQSNALEAGMIKEFVSPIDTDQEDIGIITPHNAQRGRLTDTLGEDVSGDSIDTVDRFQGSERDVILLSSTVTDPDYIRRESEFILSPNRLNVALSRMKKKLIVIVSQQLIDFIPSDADEYDDARLWKMLLSQVSQKSGGEPDWRGDVMGILDSQVQPMPVDRDVEMYTVSR